MQDINTTLEVRIGYQGAAIAGNTTTVGVITDHVNYNSLEFAVQLNARTDGTYTVNLLESDNADMSSSNAVAAIDVLALQYPIVLNAANTIKRFGYIGYKRYTQLQIVASVVTTGAYLSAVSILGNSAYNPTPGAPNPANVR